MRRLTLFALTLAVLLSSPAFAGETHPFSIHDMLAMQRISDPQVSPDGRLVAFTVRTTDLEANRGRHDIWLARTDGRETRQLTTHAAADYGARWSADGRWLYFISTRSGSAQVWKIALGGGEALPVTDLPLDVGNLAVSRDGQWIAFSMQVFPDCDTLACTTERLAAREASQATGRVYDKLFVRHWDTWKDGRRHHVFVVPSAGGEPVDMMPGMDADAPSIPWGGPEEIAFTPDSKGLVFTTRDAGREEAWSTNFDLYVAPIAAPAERRKPDGRQPGLGHAPGLLSRRQDAGLARHGEARLRVRPTPHQAHALVRRRDPHVDGGLGPLALLDRLVAPTAGRSTARPAILVSTPSSRSTSARAASRRSSWKARTGAPSPSARASCSPATRCTGPSSCGRRTGAAAS